MAISETRKLVLREMLVQYVKDMDAMNAAEKAYKAAFDKKMASDRRHTESRGAFAIFGYSGEKFFDRIRAEIGDQVWSDAFNEARGIVPEVEDEDDVTDAADADAPIPDADPEGLPTIREMVLTQLMASGSKGMKAAPIRAFVEAAIGRKLHSKTVGMTLYRLSKDGLARSEGHTWFPVDATAKTENPGAGTPGSKDGPEEEEDA